MTGKAEVVETRAAKTGKETVYELWIYGSCGWEVEGEYTTFGKARRAAREVSLPTCIVKIDLPSI